MSYEVIVDYFETEPTTETSFDFLKLSGYKSYHQQGYYGQGINVAVIDSGIVEHQELKGKILNGIAFDWYSNGKPVDDYGHGTMCSSLIVGTKCGIAPQSKILPIKTICPNGGKNDDIIKALEWLVNWKSDKGEPIDIVSMSLSTNYLDDQQKVRYENAIKKLNELNVIIICSAGNTGIEEYRYPASFSEPITVGAVDIKKKIADFSTSSNEVDCCQVGTDVYGASFKGGYCKASGTSFSTPIVSGIASLIACKYKILFGKRIPEPVLYEMLKMNTIDLDIQGVDSKTGAGFCTLNSESLLVEFWYGKKFYILNGKQIDMDVEPLGLNGRTYLPVRYVADSCGMVVEWDGKEKKVTLRK